jgi:hypothetical protein
MAVVYWLRLASMTDINSEGYVGVSSTTAKRRYIHHLSHSKKSNIHVACAIRKHGDDIIVQTVVEGSSEYCYFIENKLRPVPYGGWNTRIGGQQPKNTGVPLPYETRQKLSKALMGRKFSEETLKRMSEGRIGMKFSESHCESMRKSRLGTKASDETKAKMSASHRANPQPPLQMWEHSKANKHIWSRASEFYEGYTKTEGIFSNLLERMFELPHQSLSKMFKKLKAGWNPNEDEAYLKWLSEYKENKQYGS